MRRILTWLSLAVALHAQSGGVYHAADEVLSRGYNGIVQTSQSPPAILAPGGLATILHNFGQVPPSALELYIRPAGLNATVPAQVVEVTSDRLTFLVPRELAPGQIQIIYRADRDISRWVSAVVAPSRLLLFHSWFSGPLVAQRPGFRGALEPVGLATPASPGKALVLWGSGLGSVAPSDVSLTLGGVSQKLLFAGPSPGSPGLDQFNILVAPGTPSGCYVPLELTYGAKSITSTLSVSSDGSPCPHPFDLSVDDLRSLDRLDNVTAGRIDVDSSLTVSAVDHVSRQETISLSILPRGPSEFQSASAPEMPIPGCSYLAPGPVTPTLGAFLIVPFPVFGPLITATNGTNSVAISTTGSPPEPQFAFSYSAALPSRDTPLASIPAPVLTGGQWTFSSPSNPTATFRLTLPQPLQLLGSVPAIFRHATDGTVTWRGSDYGPTDLASVTISAAGSPYLTPPTVQCSAPADQGTVSIPADLLSKLPRGMASLTVRVSPRLPAPTSVPVTRDSGKTFSPLVIIPNVSTSETLPVDIQ